MSMVKRTHVCNDHFKLKSYKKLFKCDGCKMRGLGKRYLCNLCGDELHKECRYPKATTTHKYFGRSIFAFRETPFTRPGKKNRMEYSKVCNACGKDICGFSYHCEAENLDLHPCCSNLKDKVVIGDTTFNCSSNVSSKCMWCNNRKVPNAGKRGVPGWSYVSSCNKYHLHVYCMMEMVQEVYTKSKGDSSSLERVDVGGLVKPKKRKRGSSVIKMIKLLLKIVLSALLGDTAAVISNTLIELFPCGLE